VKSTNKDICDELLKVGILAHNALDPSDSQALSSPMLLCFNNATIASGTNLLIFQNLMFVIPAV